MNKKIIPVILFSLMFLPIFADYNRFGIPDSSEIRKDLIETWFEAPLSMVRMNKPEIRIDKIGQKFQIRLEETEDYFSILVAPYARLEVDVYSDKGKSTEMQDVYPGDAPGSWILVRDKKTGKPIKVQYFFASDSDVFIQFIPEGPDGRNSYADFVVYNCYATKGVSTGLPFSRFYTSSFAEIQKWTEKKLPWEYTKIYTDSYHSTLQMIGVIRKNLPEIVLTDDAMYDEDEKPVYISTGKKRALVEDFKDKITVSGAGFLKWIADGLVVPISGGGLKREPLIVETVEYKSTGYQGILAENYDISFSIDWIRNLASAIVSVKTGVKYLYNESGVDVKIEPFASQLTDKGIVNICGFVPNSGYSIKGLKSLLYILAVTEPETCYFAAVRETDLKSSPEVKVFNKCLVFFPYFDSDGKFKCSTFMDCDEIDFEDFCDRYCNDTVYLTRARCSENFYPLTISSQE